MASLSAKAKKSSGSLSAKAKDKGSLGSDKVEIKPPVQNSMQAMPSTSNLPPPPPPPLLYLRLFSQIPSLRKPGNQGAQ